MTRITIIVSLWLLLVGTISDSALEGGEHGPLALYGLYALVTALALGALWIHLSDDPAEALHPPRRQPFRWD